MSNSEFMYHTTKQFRSTVFTDVYENTMGHIFARDCAAPDWWMHYDRNGDAIGRRHVSDITTLKLRILKDYCRKDVPSE